MKSFLHVIFAFIFHFIATTSVVATDNIRLKVGIIILQLIFIVYQIIVITQKDKMK
jgi:hypothetical protein